MSKTMYLEGQTLVYDDLKLLRNEFREYNITIDPCVEIGDKVELSRGVKIGKGCIIKFGCVIGENTVLHPEVKLGKCVIVESNCTILSGAKIVSGANICEGITIGEDNLVGDTWLDKKFHIKGSKASVTYVGNDIFCIGCKHNHIDLYTDEFLDELGAEYNYTNEQIDEYKGYIKQAKEFINNIKLDNDRSSF